MAATQHSSAMLALLDSVVRPRSAARGRASNCSSSSTVAVVPIAFPMWLARCGRSIDRQHRKSGTLLPTHDELQEQGLLVRWQPGMNTMFLSHTWLGYEHPGPQRRQVPAARGAPRGHPRRSHKGHRLLGSDRSWSDWGVAGEELARKYSDGYVWMDYSAFLQRNGRTKASRSSRSGHYVATRLPTSSCSRARGSTRTGRSATCARGPSAAGAAWSSLPMPCRPCRRR